MKKLAAAILFIALFGACGIKSEAGPASPTADYPTAAKETAQEVSGGVSESIALFASPSKAQESVEPIKAPSNAPDPGVPVQEPSKAVKEVSIPVLNYHSIGKEPDNSLVLDPDKFAKQMEYLSAEGYTPLTLSDFTQMLEKKKMPPAKPVLLTFDDGYADNYQLAMPVLKKYGFHAALFMSPGLVGQEGYLNWEQVKEMHEAGWDIEPHGLTHSNLAMLKEAEQRYEITEARRQIEERLGVKADIFCYPYGQYNKTTLAILKREGFRYAFTIKQGRATSSQPPLELKRIYVNGKDSLAEWIRKLSG